MGEGKSRGEEIEPGEGEAAAVSARDTEPR